MLWRFSETAKEVVIIKIPELNLQNQMYEELKNLKIVVVIFIDVIISEILPYMILNVSHIIVLDDR